MTRLFDCKPFIVAEVGSNWATLSDCIQSISAAKACGADAVKFQAFTHEALYGFAAPSVTPIDVHSLPVAWLPKLKEKADACGIELMVTAFSPELVAAVDPFVTVHKVASSDNGCPQLLEAVKRTGKPVLLSCGAAGKGDVQKAVYGYSGWAGFGDTPVVVLYCNAAYPSRRHNLFLMQELKELTGKPVGLSDHSLDVIYAPLSAVKHFGAVVIEKHFTAVPELDSPDRGHSLTTDEFKIMTDYLRGKRDGGGFNPTSEERAMFLRHNRRLIATQDLAAGAQLRYGENFGAYRSLVDDTRGLSPFAWESVEGRTTTKQINRGEAIGPGDFL